VKDTCAGCHVGTPTAAQGNAHQSSNHTFEADLTICSSCHGDGVDGAALQASVQSQLTLLDQTIAAKSIKLISAAVVAKGTYFVRAYDPATDEYSSTSVSNVALTVAPTNLTSAEIHGQSAFIFTMATPVTINWVNAAGAPAGSTTSTTFQVPAGNIQAGTPLAAILPAGGILGKSIWNYHLLDGDGTKGIHNLPFYQQVIGATNAQLNTL